jgi:hypothetical protein
MQFPTPKHGDPAFEVFGQSSIGIDDLDVVIQNEAHVILGQGSFAKVYLCRHKLTHRLYALKVVL